MKRIIAGAILFFTTQTYAQILDKCSDWTNDSVNAFCGWQQGGSGSSDVTDVSSNPSKRRSTKKEWDGCVKAIQGKKKCDKALFELKKSDPPLSPNNIKDILVNECAKEMSASAGQKNSVGELRPSPADWKKCLLSKALNGWPEEYLKNSEFKKLNKKSKEVRKELCKKHVDDIKPFVGKETAKYEAQRCKLYIDTGVWQYDPDTRPEAYSMFTDYLKGEPCFSIMVYYQSHCYSVNDYSDVFGSDATKMKEFCRQVPKASRNDPADGCDKNPTFGGLSGNQFRDLMDKYSRKMCLARARNQFMYGTLYYSFGGKDEFDKMNLSIVENLNSLDQYGYWQSISLDAVPAAMKSKAQEGIKKLKEHIAKSLKLLGKSLPQCDKDYLQQLAGMLNRLDKGSSAFSVKHNGGSATADEEEKAPQGSSGAVSR